MRMRLPSYSATAKSPFENKAISAGPLKDAPVPLPSTEAAVPEPASVVTTRDGEMRRIRSFPYSATAMLPLASIATPAGSEKSAEVPTPLAYPDTLPAIVETTPSGVINRMRPLCLSAIT